MFWEGFIESESIQEDLEEEEEEEDGEEEEDCIQVKDEEGESGVEEGFDLEEFGVGYKKLFLDVQFLQLLQVYQVFFSLVIVFYQVLGCIQFFFVVFGGMKSFLDQFVKYFFIIGVVYDMFMLKYQCMCGNIYVYFEYVGWIQSIWFWLQEIGLFSKCE